MGSHMIECMPFPDFCGPWNLIRSWRFHVLFLDWTFHTRELGVRSAIGRFDSPACYVCDRALWYLTKTCSAVTRLAVNRPRSINTWHPFQRKDILWSSIVFILLTIFGCLFVADYYLSRHTALHVNMTYHGWLCMYCLGWYARNIFDDGIRSWIAMWMTAGCKIVFHNLGKFWHSWSVPGSKPVG